MQQPHGPAEPVGDAAADAHASPELQEALRALGASGRATLGAASDATKALRILVAADISLARSAFGRALAFTGVAIAFGASAWLLLMAALIAWLSLGLGLAWSLSLLLSAGLSLAVTAIAAHLAMRYFGHTGLQATRRQLARLGNGELAGLMADAGAPVNTAAGVDVTPP
ncbi:phage holin family protein [Thermomonas sp.]|jgi:hypothetical protein|uniref:phage holin family protein n=1 Tax=Thermomonas sp. TaxID=1971895 RepID=UPI001B786C38|nr:phage holin family protein [Thermomonas sp.]MBK6416005.1 phage holin family protein [Thermomonas sp.]MBK7205082.1 phage holin family protein [Thermomonas sp.]MBK9669928.1 phage holin family protein [Thermomonas sp.]MBL0228248.1 phage holin family protein [Thermomonas sp.]MBP7158448.1 phage holin family protein [Thermomonas sp.]